MLQARQASPSSRRLHRCHPGPQICSCTAAHQRLHHTQGWLRSWRRPGAGAASWAAQRGCWPAVCRPRPGSWLGVHPRRRRPGKSAMACQRPAAGPDVSMPCCHDAVGHVVPQILCTYGRVRQREHTDAVPMMSCAQICWGVCAEAGAAGWAGARSSVWRPARGH